MGLLLLLISSGNFMAFGFPNITGTLWSFSYIDQNYIYFHILKIVHKTVLWTSNTLIPWLIIESMHLIIICALLVKIWNFSSCWVKTFWTLDNTDLLAWGICFSSFCLALNLSISSSSKNLKWEKIYKWQKLFVCLCVFIHLEE